MEYDISVSIIMEWENAALTETSRVKTLLDIIQKQIHELFDSAVSNAKLRRDFSFLGRIRQPIEIVVAFHHSIDKERFLREITATIAINNPEICLSLVPTPEQRYFELKNTSAASSCGDILVFLDSDVIPQPNWLITLLGSFENPQIEIVGSNCFVQHKNLYQKSYAAIKFGEPSTSIEIIKSYDIAHGNSIAFRRNAYEEYKFPPTGYTYKLPFKYFIEALKQDNFPIYVNMGAQIEHPAPLPKNFLKRGFFHGRDEMILRQDRKIKAEIGDESRSITYWGMHELTLAKARFCRIATYRKKWNIAIWELPLVYCIVAAYYSAVLTGYLITQMLPTYSRNKFDYLTMLQ